MSHFNSEVFGILWYRNYGSVVVLFKVVYRLRRN